MSQPSQPDIIIDDNIGHSSTDDKTRRIAAHIVKPGFVEWHKQHYGPLLDKGYRHFMRRNPGGALATGPMQYDQWDHLDALNIKRCGSDDWTAGSLWLYEQGAQIIDYYGSAAETPSMRALVGDPGRWGQKAWSCIAPSLRAGAGIAFDATANLPDTHLIFHVMDRLKEMGIPAIGEAWPQATTTKAHQHGVYAKYTLWKRDIVDGGAKRLADPKDITGPVYIACGTSVKKNENPNLWVKTLQAQITEIKEAGYTPLLGSGAIDVWEGMRG